MKGYIFIVALLALLTSPLWLQVIQVAWLAKTGQSLN